MITDEPLGANPYLWVSQEMEVTPGTRKSKGGSTPSNPALDIYAITKEPKQQSTSKQANIKDSVPPEVVDPQASLAAEPLNMLRTMETISDSILRTPGKTSGSPETLPDSHSECFKSDKLSKCSKICESERCVCGTIWKSGTCGVSMINWLSIFSIVSSTSFSTLDLSKREFKILDMIVLEADLNTIFGYPIIP
ncbi:hypothetical protein WICPIJ_006225 [Wickerhamomyces pijperi]|uniref:Uncharacterized protein n=1 Tax=Wickerhamomyces pijperi TaxID=599730 RepID=A0A9P8Q2E3_WICPI|nr:hypothetical protein WICPIJ_006225 [Wickerhamomyces pijperi]